MIHLGLDLQNFREIRLKVVFRLNRKLALFPVFGDSTIIHYYHLDLIVGKSLIFSIQGQCSGLFFLFSYNP